MFKRGSLKFVSAGLILLSVLVVARVTGLTEHLGLDGIDRLRAWIDGFGPISPIIFIAVYIVATVAFFPGTPLTILAGLMFGPLWGALWTMVGATLGAILAFLVGRYAARGLVESWTANNEQLRRLDDGVEKQGWRMLVITRLVPLFPFNLQNYAYGLTRVRLGVYALVTGVCMAPGVLAYTFAGGSVAAARDDLGTTFVYLGVAAVLFVLISLIPGWIRKRGKQ